MKNTLSQPINIELLAPICYEIIPLMIFEITQKANDIYSQYYLFAVTYDAYSIEEISLNLLKCANTS